MAENKTVTYQGKTYTANSKGKLTEVSGQEREDYFVIIKRGTLQIRKNTTARDSTNILEKLSHGKVIKIVIPQNIVKNEGISWIQVYADSSKTEKGWVDKTLIYPDKPIETLYLNHPTIDYRNVEGEFNGTPKSLDYIDIWGGPGQGNYSSRQQKDGNGRYKVAIAPKIIYPEYPDDGKVEDEDFNGFSKNITVCLKNKISGANKDIQCVVTDFNCSDFELDKIISNEKNMF